MLLRTCVCYVCHNDVKLVKTAKLNAKIAKEQKFESNTSCQNPTNPRCLQHLTCQLSAWLSFSKSRPSWQLHSNRHQHHTTTRGSMISCIAVCVNIRVSSYTPITTPPPISPCDVAPGASAVPPGPCPWNIILQLPAWMSFQKTRPSWQLRSNRAAAFHKFP